jgi:hypothetical protein
MLVKRLGRKATRRSANSLMTTESCMLVSETGGRKCERCSGSPEVLHVPYKGKGAFCPCCCPNCAPPPAA